MKRIAGVYENLIWYIQFCSKKTKKETIEQKEINHSISLHRWISTKKYYKNLKKMRKFELSLHCKEHTNPPIYICTGYLQRDFSNRLSLCIIFHSLYVLHSNCSISKWSVKVQNFRILFTLNDFKVELSSLLVILFFF